MAGWLAGWPPISFGIIIPGRLTKARALLEVQQNPVSGSRLTHFRQQVVWWVAKNFLKVVGMEAYLSPAQDRKVIASASLSVQVPE